jgi:hypothetical protein
MTESVNLCLQEQEQQQQQQKIGKTEKIMKASPTFILTFSLAAMLIIAYIYVMDLY